MCHLQGLEPGALSALLYAPGCCLCWLPLLEAPGSQPWWAAGSGLSAVSLLLEGFLVTLLAQPESGQCDLALPHPLGPCWK